MSRVFILIIVAFAYISHVVSRRSKIANTIMQSQKSLLVSPDNAPLMARYIVNQANWTALATISIKQNFKGFPFSSLLSVSDGPIGAGSGVINLLFPNVDLAYHNYLQDKRVSLMMTLAQEEYCVEKNYDPMDPRCARVMFLGTLKEFPVNSRGYNASKSALRLRHAWLIDNTPPTHTYHYVQFDIKTAIVFDKFGVPSEITAQDYYDAHKLAEYCSPVRYLL